MPILTDLELDLDVNQVLRGQGVSDPDGLRKRNPRLVKIAEQALQEGQPLLEPQVMYEQIEVDQLKHERLVLKNRKYVSGQLLSLHCYNAEEIIVILCTIGSALEIHAGLTADSDIVYGLALDGLGSAAVEALANKATAYFEQRAITQGMKVSIPLSPGMIGWDTGKGQSEIFQIIDHCKIGVEVNGAGVMNPAKSLTMALGIGKDINKAGRTCDYCSARAGCAYQEHYDPVQAHAAASA